ncbi:MBL fold metallo-hydrolase [Psychrobacter sp. FDAARGOS_221]|uniref:MBL fold metallo-hydrolase n=1 Tax=Psychrobacter sp. FDAARGOS_221 TaxID=1975705 RepID=UPI000BB577C4|nr:MBL fold metallo-hydrolase [Psychrobacter sp. FDAARGOS_221]PNK61324.1 Zn-dependent hydrolase [Psychrobacter sp. FDAARGOS_221]
MSLVDVVAIKGHIQNTYLAVYPDKLLLLDSGCRSDVEPILSYITQTLQRPVTQLKTVVVSHMHPDHAGGAKLLQQKTGCQIVAAAVSKPWYSGVKGRVQHLNDLALTYYVASRRGKSVTNLWYQPILKADMTLVDGDAIPGFEDWIAVATPGHTGCDLSFWHQPSKQVYTGDLILKIKNKLVSPLVINFPQDYKQSLAKVQALQPERVLLAHGGKVMMTDADFANLIQVAPDEPREMKILETLDIKLPKFIAAKLSTACK